MLRLVQLPRRQGSAGQLRGPRIGRALPPDLQRAGLGANRRGFTRSPQRAVPAGTFNARVMFPEWLSEVESTRPSGAFIGASTGSIPLSAAEAGGISQRPCAARRFRFAAPRGLHTFPPMDYLLGVVAACRRGKSIISMPMPIPRRASTRSPFDRLALPGTIRPGSTVKAHSGPSAPRNRLLVAGQEAIERAATLFDLRPHASAENGLAEYPPRSSERRPTLCCAAQPLLDPR